MRCTVAAAALLAALTLGGTPASGQTDQQVRSRADELAARVRAETRRIGRTQAGVDRAQARLDRIDAELAEQRARQARTAREIVAARDRIERLENRMHRASDALADNLRSRYLNDPPDLVSVILSATSFSDLINQASFTRKVAEHNANVLEDARESKAEVALEADRLVVLQREIERTSKAVAERAERAAAIRDALLAVQRRQVAKRARTAASLADLRATIRRLQAQRTREARRAIGNPADGIGSGTTTTPAGAPAAVGKVIAAGNAIAGLPYIYGGGHGSFRAAGYDCSGSVSYALAAAGLLDTPLDSTGFMSWGEPGPGKWITVYANPGHAYMVVAGRRFDTSALRGGGTRWTNEPRSSAGFVARHPPGL